ncbi:MAG: HD domain-containing protein [Candidatus Saganbacteria bacterium]|nr:HD domain-containing protein [Candidatus Saganbacteria bacterium]
MIRQLSLNFYPIVSARKSRHWQIEQNARMRARARLPQNSSIEQPILIGRFGSLYIGSDIAQVKPVNVPQQVDELLALMHLPSDYRDREILVRACELAWEAHYGQKRRDGSHYYSHPLAVAKIVAGWGLGIEEVSAALLHDVIEDGEINGRRITREYLSWLFGGRIANLADGVTELGKEPKFKGAKPSVAEIYRKLFEYGDRDLAILIIKLADRLHNMQTLEYTSEKTQQEKAQETMNVYARIADILGMWQLKRELEDWSFRYLDPENHRLFDIKIFQALETGRHDILRIEKELELVIEELPYPVEMVFERRYVYELFQRAQLRGIKPDDLLPRDIWRINLNVPTREDCYKLLGYVHAIYPPVQGEFRDYIADPMPNGHRFLHTYVEMPHFGKLLVQLRSREMYDLYQRGIIAAIRLREGWQEQNQNWLKASLASLEEEKLSAEETYEIIKAVSTPITIYTPREESKELPFGSSVLDFARAIHEEVFLRTEGAILNGRPILIPIHHRLDHGDRIEVVRAASETADISWFEYLRTPAAIKTLRAYLRSRSNTEKYQNAIRALDSFSRKYYLPAQELVNTALFDRYVSDKGYQDNQELIYMIGTGEVRAGRVSQELLELFKDEFTRAVKNGREMVPYYLSVETEDRPGKLNDLISALTLMRYNIADIFQVASETEGKAMIVLAVDVFKGIGEAGMLRHIQTIQVKEIADTVGTAQMLRPERVEAYLAQKREQIKS